MKQQIAFGYQTLNIGSVTVFTIKLRFHSSSWSFIQKRIEEFNENQEKIECTTTQNLPYYTLTLSTLSYDTYQAVADIIARGQQEHLEAYLREWKRFQYKPSMKNIYWEEDTSAYPKSVGRIDLP